MTHYPENEPSAKESNTVG